MTPPIDKQEYYSALGKITVCSNHLEHWMRSCLLIIHGEEVFRFLMAWLATENFDRILKVLRFSVYYKLSDKSKLKRFDSVYNRITHLNVARNKYVHSRWLFAIDDSFVLRSRNLKYPLYEDETNPSVEELNKLADNLAEMPKILLDFINEVFPRPPAAPRTSNKSKTVK
jgi:hypothetical protein